MDHYSQYHTPIVAYVRRTTRGLTQKEFDDFVPTHQDWYNVLLMRMVADVQKNDDTAVLVAFKFGSIPSVVFMNHLRRPSGSNITMHVSHTGDKTYHEGWFAVRMPSYRDKLTMWVFKESIYSETTNNVMFDCLKMFTPNSMCLVNTVRIPTFGIHADCGVDVNKVIKMKDTEFVK